MLKNTKEQFRFLLLISAALALVLSVEYLGFFNGVDTYFYDTILRLRGSRPVSDRIVIVAIDSKSLDAFGAWPLKRRCYAEMLDRIGPAAVVGFDLLMMEPTDDDPILEASILRHGRVVLPEYVSSSLSITKPAAKLSPYRTGHVHIELGIDNTARGIFHSIHCNGELLPSMASVMFDTISSDKLLRNQPPAGTNAVGIMIQQDVRKINYYGPPGRFRQVSLADVISGRVPGEFFRDKIVLVGLTAPGIVDQVSTPFSQSRNRMPGVEVHANIINNLLDKSFIRDVTGRVRTVAVCFLSLVLSVFYLRLNEKNAALLWCFSLFLVTVVTSALFTLYNVWLSLSVFYVSFSMVYVLSYLNRLDKAARKLDKEHDVMMTLLGWDADETPVQPPMRGLFGFLSEGGLNGKIQRQIRMTTKLLKMNKHLEKALKAEREALDNQMRLVEMLSHEYRTPLAIIRANLDILEMKDDDAGGLLSTNFGKMKRAMSRLVEIMDISLRRERLEDPHQKMDSNVIALVPFIRSVLKEARELWAERNLEFEFDDNDGVSVVGDASLLKTALLNLIDNAVKYSAENEPVRVLLDITGNEAIIRVQNYGAVISADDLGRVFEKYYRGYGSGNTRGAGLGLYLVRRIIEQQHGRVSLSSSENDGTVATVRLVLENM